MSRAQYSSNKRQRETERSRKQREKAERRAQKRMQGTGEVEVTTAAAMTGNLPTVDEALRRMEARAAAPSPSAGIPCRLFVGGLHRETSEVTLRAAFADHGTVTDAVVVKDRDTGMSRGFGFVTMDNHKDAARAVKALDQSELDGRIIAVNVTADRGR